MQTSPQNSGKPSILGLPRPLALGVFIIVALYALSKAMKHTRLSDFYTLWDAGRNFWLGGDMYFREGLRPFSYPPFSALILSAFTFPFLPSDIAAMAFATVEAVLMVACMGLAATLLREHLGKAADTGTLLLALLFTAPFFINTLNLLQVNLILLLFTLLFIRYYTLGRDVPAAFFLALAIMFKILPGLYLVWLLLRGRMKALLWTAGFLCIFTLSVLVIRGPGQGIKDHLEFKQNLSKYTQSSEGETVSVSKSISLRALALETMQRLSMGLPRAAVLNSITLGCLVLYAAWLVVLRKRNTAPLPDLLGSLLVIPLMATTTESHHMVMLFPPLLFLLVALRDNKDMRPWYRLLLVICILVTLSSKDIVGKAMVGWLSSHGLYALHPAVILAAMAANSLRRKPL